MEDQLEKDFTIDKVSWHTQTAGNPESRDHVLQRFYSLVFFLQAHHLTKRVLLHNINEITDDFSVKTSDLTEAGLEFMKRAYDKWLSRIDRGADPQNVDFLETELEKLIN